MRLVSANVNGIRAAVRRGGLEWLAAQNADVICLQEVRASDEQLAAALGDAFDGWHVAHRPSGQRAGHAGVAILAPEPLEITADLGCADDEGRWLAVRIGDLDVACVYVHAGQADTPIQDDKHRFLDAMGKWMEQHDRALVCGDLNVAHTEADIKNWKGNIGKAGFLESERAYLRHWYENLGWVDLGCDAGYTWWSWRGKAFDNDAGWRIDCVLASPEIAASCRSFTVGRAPSYAERWSDHAPVVVELERD